MKSLKQTINESLYVNSLKGFEKNSDEIKKYRDFVKTSHIKIATYLGSSAFESIIPYNDIDLYLNQEGNVWYIDMYLDVESEYSPRDTFNKLVLQLKNDSLINKYCSDVFQTPCTSDYRQLAKRQGIDFEPTNLIKMKIK